MPSDNPEMLYLTAQTHYLNPQMLYLMAQTCHMSPQILYLTTQIQYPNPRMPYLTAQTHYLNPQMLYLTTQTHYLNPQMLYLTTQTQYLILRCTISILKIWDHVALHEESLYNSVVGFLLACICIKQIIVHLVKIWGCQFVRQKK